MYVYRTATLRDRSAAVAERVRAHGIDMQILDCAQARAMEPALNDSVCGAQFYPGDARLRPDRFLAELARVVRMLGADVREHCPATAFELDGDRIAGVVTP